MRNKLFFNVLVLPLWWGAFNGAFLSSASAGSPVPHQPLGMRGFIDPWYKAFAVLWEPVTKNTDGSQADDVVGYNIYRRTTLKGPAVRINSTLCSIPVYGNRVDGRTFYYSVRAVNSNGVESRDSFLVDSSPATNVIYLAEDGLSSVTMPDKVNELLRSSHNKLKVPLTIKLIEEPLPRDPAVVRHVRLQLLRGDTSENVNDLEFAISGADINIGYNSVDGQVALGEPQSQSLGASSILSATPEQLILFRFNGKSWVNMGGINEPQGQTISVKSSQLGMYQVRVGKKATALSLEKALVYPALLTPNGDGLNDHVYVVLENPTNAFLRGELFDLSGRSVASLPVPVLTGVADATFSWTGHDSNGLVVPSGLYVYRIEGDGKGITGTLSVAR